MRVFIAVLILIFSLQSWTKADDISDFEIEGMSIGDSLLDYFNESEIKNAETKYYPGDKKFFNIFYTSLPQFKVYDQIQILLKTGDKKYKIYGITGAIDFKNNLTNCLKKKEEIASELSEFLKDIIEERSDRKGEYTNDTKSVYYASEFFFLNKIGGARVFCNDWSDNRRDVKVSIDSAEIIYWLTNEAWE